MSFKDTIAVRQGEELNLEKLEAYIKKEMNVPDAPIEVEQFPAGASNLTYQLKIGDWEAVLRRPPLGPVAPKAHDMGREFMILQEIHPLFPVAPEAYLFSSDESIVGSPFFVMERRKGIVIDQNFPKEIDVTEDIRRKLSETMVDTLADLHQIDYTKTRLTEISKPDGFLERQVQGWISRYYRSKTDEIEGLEQLTNWLANSIPASPSPTIIHYDFKLNNAMFSAEDVTKIVGLFDWEMTTVGDPLADLGVALSYWVQADDPDLLKYGFGKPPVTTEPGFFTRRQFIERYASRTGRDVSDIHFYLTFAYFKLAVIVQQIYYRYKKGQTSDQRFSRFNERVASLIQHGLFVSTERL